MDFAAAGTERTGRDLLNIGNIPPEVMLSVRMSFICHNFLHTARNRIENMPLAVAPEFFFRSHERNLTPNVHMDRQSEM